MKNRLHEKQKLQNYEKEIMWHRQGDYLDSGHWTSHFPFASRERHWLHNDVQRIRFYCELHKYLKRTSALFPAAYRGDIDSTTIANLKLLLAPVGNGIDASYLRAMLPKIQEIHGIDISPVALNACPKFIVAKEADIAKSGYEDQSFDLIVCSQFLHHVHDVGFEPFIEEFFRILRKGGILAILEPSNPYPFGWATALARKFVGNVSGLVEGEHPVHPSLITSSLKRIGFLNLRVRGLLYSHVRFPSIGQHIIDSLDFPLRILYPFKLFANSIGWYCSKP